VNTGAVNMETPFAAGSICSTSRDLVLWANALASGRVVKPESYKVMTSPVSFPSAYRMTYGFALTVDTMGTRRTVAHGGNINGFSSNLLTVPAESLYVAVNINVSGAPATGISADIARAVLGVPRVAVAPRDEPMSAAERAKFVGRYRMGEPNGTRREYTIGEQDDHLTLVLPGGVQTMILERVGKGEFAVRGQGAARVLFDMSGDAVTGMVIARGVRPLMGTRVP
jgi:D-alanyl-D-alanine carboxypeptidase